MIKNASSIPISQNSGTLPQMNTTIFDWMQKVSFSIVTKSVVNFQLVEVKSVVQAMAVWQPFTAEQLLIKEIGQRSWLWVTLHSDTSLVLNVDDIVTFLGISYRVKEKLDYSLESFFEYHIVQDWTGS